MPTNFDLGAEPDPYEAYSPEDLHTLLSTYALPREPGAGYEYSNLGVALLGRLLARAANEDYEALLRERVLDPLGLDSTAVAMSPELTERLAAGHDRNLEPVRTWEMKTLPASGSLRSSANDLLTLLEAYLGYEDSPLTDAMAFQLDAVRQDIPGGVQRLGWSERSFEGVSVIGHDGGKAGYRSAILFDPAERVGVVILSNARTDDRPILLAVHLLTGLRLPPPTAAVVPVPTRLPLAPAALEALAGRYSLEGGGVLVVARKDDHLLVDRQGDGVTTIFPSDAAEFHSNTGDDVFTFSLEDDGRAAQLQWRRGSRTALATRD